MDGFVTGGVAVRVSVLYFPFLRSRSVVFGFFVGSRPAGGIAQLPYSQEKILIIESAVLKGRRFFIVMTTFIRFS